MLLDVKDLVVKYNQIPALKGISLSVEEGKVTTLLGSNGAGKSTLLKTISGVLKPSEGEIIYLGRRINNESGHDIVKMGIAQCPEGRKVFPRQTVYENLKMGAYIRKDKEVESDIEKYFKQFPILQERRNQKAGFLSGGEQQMLVICRALMSRPKLLMLDEPSMGLAPIIVKEVFNAIRMVKESGTTILLIEQNAKQALQVADYGYILEVGRITIADDADALLHSDTVQKAYLGGA
ncbi:ABC transporter ATP-binding protein [Clostridium sp. KNHs216]|uniref:ABC transporter ATP-binding protein n=1 Tax=Eubacteriales TaxID=186802 RepID=UPI00057103E1|nr:ABC transporter ATP-binding protein [Clostridium sp. KNHs216]MBE6831492.1 ABC transporter ATP-binding protein [Oscillospiraceae bacterium]TQI66993.1 branched-chain amino acid transport system ATP-binding protein [Clostridium sp. KNHs216]